MDFKWFKRIFNGRSAETIAGLMLIMLLGLTLYGTAIWIGWKGTTYCSHRYLNIGLVNLGALIGWLLGVYISPDNADEQSRFTRYSTAIGSFLTGYVLSKSDDLITKMCTTSFWNYTHALQAILLLTGLLAAMMVAFTLRAYFLASPKRSIVPVLEFQLTNQPVKLDLGQEVTNTLLLRLTRSAGNSPILLGRTMYGNRATPTVLQLATDKPIVRLANELGNGPIIVAHALGGGGASLRVEVLDSAG